MRAKTLLLSVVLAALLAFVPASSAQQREAKTEELQTLKRQLQELLQRMSKIEEQHATEVAAMSKLEGQRAAQIDSLNKQIQQLRRVAALDAGPEAKTPTEDDLEALRRSAVAEAEQETSTEEPVQETIFKSGNLGLQSLNPEISVTGDMLGFFREGDDVTTTSEMTFRGLGLHFESYLDPYSRFKAAIPIGWEGAELGEAYFTRYGVFRNTNLTLGKFRQQFGVVNRWHKHALDWMDFPLALRMAFGPGGLNQTGFSLDSNGSIGRTVHEFVFQTTTGTTGKILGQNTKNRPSLLGHYKIYRDFTSSTYAELGGTGFVGWNNEWQLPYSTIDETQTAAVYGLDFTIAWEPLDRMRYRNFEWRTEAYIVDKAIQAPDSSGVDHISPWGLYSSMMSKMTRTIEIGLRFDYYRPETRSYAVDPPMSLSQIVTTEDAYRQQTGAFLTWWQSPFVRFRAGYAYASGRGTGANENIVGLQMVFAAGPHKHERY